MTKSKSPIRTRTTAALLAGLGVTAGGLAGAGVPALAGSAPTPATAVATPTTTPDTTPDGGGTTGTDDGAVAPGERGRPRLDAWLTEALQPLIDDGTITQEQADAVVAALSDAVPTRGPARLGMSVEVLTDLLGVTAEDLGAAFAEGQSIADVAAAQGVDVQVVVDALVASATERIDALVDAGTMTAEQAAEREAELAERIAEMVNRAGGPDLGRFGRRHHGGPGHHGPGGPGGPGTAETTDTMATDA